MPKLPTTTELLDLIAPKTNINVSAAKNDPEFAAFTINGKHGLESYQIRVPNLAANRLNRIAHKASELNYRTKNRVIYSEYSDTKIALPCQINEVTILNSASAPNICVEHLSQVYRSYGHLEPENLVGKEFETRSTIKEPKISIVNAPKLISRDVSGRNFLRKSSTYYAGGNSTRPNTAVSNIRKKKLNKPKESAVINSYEFNAHASIPRIVEEDEQVIVEGSWN